MEPNSKFNMKFIWMICLTAALGGLLFGYDWVVIGGAKPFYEAYFNLTSSFQVGWAMSCALVGCMAGSVLSGGLSDKFGRRRLLIFSGFLFTLSAIGTGWSESFNCFVVFRLIGGVGIGLASNLSPMYIAEISPASMRGRFVSINQLTIVIGILAAQIVNYLIAEPVETNATAEMILKSWNGQWGWRWMFWVETIPAFLFFLFMFLVPESPRWLVKNGKDETAGKVLEKIGEKSYAQDALTNIKKSLVNEIEKVNFRELLEPRLMKILLLGVVLAVFQQWCGINVIFNYAHEIFTQAGYGVSDMLFNIVITGIVNLMFTFVAIYTVDRLGRRKLMLSGAGGLAIIYLFIGLSYYFQFSGVHVLILVVMAIACYSCTLAPVTWVIISEIFPNRIRGAAMSIAVTMLWIACFVLTYTFPILNKKLGTAVTFWIYMVICVLGFCFIKRSLPETKGKTLEEIEIELTGK
ncbi:MAG: sugar porter family MFS transporter [Sedimentisphaerales bacterium]|nr:sugar porter family MFS transporter [Sedimentisphaerales bacterium]